MLAASSLQIARRSRDSRMLELGRFLRIALHWLECASGGQRERQRQQHQGNRRERSQLCKRPRNGENRREASRSEEWQWPRAASFSSFRSFRNYSGFRAFGLFERTQSEMEIKSVCAVGFFVPVAAAVDSIDAARCLSLVARCSRSRSVWLCCSLARSLSLISLRSPPLAADSAAASSSQCQSLQWTDKGMKTVY